MICDHWQVAIVPFPFMERPAVKRRPALAISGGNFNESNGHTVFAMITTAKLEQWPSDYILRDTKTAGLNVSCYVRWKIFTLPNQMITRIAGSLGSQDREALIGQLKTNFVGLQSIP